MLTFRDGTPRPFRKLTPARYICVQYTARRVRQPHLRLAIALLLEILAGTGQSATCSRRAYKSVDLPLHLFPYFRTSGDIMGVGIRRIVELVCPDRVLQLLCKLFGLVVVILGILERDSRHGVDLGPKHPQEVNLLLAL